MLYKFSTLDNYQDSIHYRDSFTATIVIVKFLLSLSIKYKHDLVFIMLWTLYTYVQLCRYKWEHVVYYTNDNVETNFDKPLVINTKH